ncbi:NADPH:quinone reductase-like Zn-dependent oxidoreductase [Lipingzhangella halophila]|uniref:NADPH:quinone reductase-like Zn-dependent oxidoreductase n=1 Tax=Lipingzhangella halophila TaxID=1783352 RepID=A0A7W7RNJ8_9ACTN|nr:NADPH:quinone oxidoreductase family protein [Lipingzhangella halophila]MBB4935304.1 NADPH:quinone reductase-like Zn-dependent oxidoreductase [Lipingzhangella halophila]
MRAVQVTSFGSPPELAVVELADPRPDAGEVVIDTRAAGVNFPDLLVTGGTYQNLPPLPFVPGKELAGVVTAVGPDVRTPGVGTRVAAQVEHGAFAARVAVPAANAVPVPDGVDDDTAAAMGMGYLTAHFALARRAALREGEDVLVTGANGDVGSAAVQLAAYLGGRVIAYARSEEYADHLRRAGASHVLTGDAGTLRDRVRELTGGAGAGVVIETVGGEVFRQALRCVAWEGRLVVCGFAGGEVPAVPAGHVLVKNLAVLGLQVSDYRDREPETMRRVQGELMTAVGGGRIGVPIAARFPLGEVAGALEFVRKGRRFGKAVLSLR